MFNEIKEIDIMVSHQLLLMILFSQKWVKFIGFARRV